MQFKLAILSVLAKRPDGHARLDELKREVAALTSREDQPEEISSALRDIDIFQSALVIAKDGGFQITDAGRSALKALESSSKPSLDFPSGSSSHSLELIDDLIGSEERRKIFDLELRGLDESCDPGTMQEEPDPQSAATERPAAAQEADTDDVSANKPRIAQETETADFRINAAIAADPTEVQSRDAPTFLMQGFGSGARAYGQTPARGDGPFASIATNIRSVRRFWRRHLEQDLPNVSAGHRADNARGGLFALLSLLLIIICAGAVIATVQIKSLKSEIVTLQRELVPLKERVAKAEAEEKMRRDNDQLKEAEDRTGVDKSKALGNHRIEQAPLSLSREEVQIIREYIKPAPFTGPPAAPINVGDPVSGGTIPLPSPLTDKIPKLLGARFAIRNGAIVIVRRDSHQADAVLGSN